MPSKSREQNKSVKEESAITKPVQIDLGEEIDKLEEKEVSINDVDTTGDGLHVEFRPVSIDMHTILDGLENFEKTLPELKKSLKIMYK